MAISALRKRAGRQQLIEAIVLLGVGHAEPDVAKVCAAGGFLPSENNHLPGGRIKDCAVGMARCRTRQGPHLSTYKRNRAQENEKKKAKLLHGCPFAFVKENR